MNYSNLSQLKIFFKFTFAFLYLNSILVKYLIDLVVLNFSGDDEIPKHTEVKVFGLKIKG